MSYDQFLATKRQLASPVGIDDPPELSSLLFPFQRDVTRWALRIGKAAIWADCGLGKSWMAIEWARCVAEHTGRPVLILTPLAVARQFVSEGEKIGVDVQYLSEPGDAKIVVTNYEKLHRFDASSFAGIVLDESSVLKDYTSKTRNQLVDAFADTPFRLCCTATPAPNDFVELGNHAEFIGSMKRTEMLSMFFVHDGARTIHWRLKGHASNEFWRWLSSWAVNLKKPSDLGYDDDGYDLPDLNMHMHVVDVDDDKLAKESGMLFVDIARGLSEQRAARRASLDDRVSMAAEMVNASADPWIVWCDMNDESSALSAAIPDAVEVRGSDSPEDKEDRIWGFLNGDHRVLVTKPSIAGHGLNMQHCRHVAFVGVSHSFERWYQAIRRCWRFGQTGEVNCHVITSRQEGAVVANLQRKQSDADELTRGMVAHMSDLSRAAIGKTKRETTGYDPAKEMRVPAWLV